MTIEDIEKEVIEWHRATFPNATLGAIEKKIAEELYEFGTVINTEGSKPKDYWNEFADVIITHMAYLAKSSNGEVTLAGIINWKLDINRQREWGEETENGNRDRKCDCKVDHGAYVKNGLWYCKKCNKKEHGLMG